MAEENQKLQVLDAHGLDLFTGKLKDGTLAVGKANSAKEAPWEGITGKPGAYPPEEHTHDAGEAGVEAIPDATIEAIISGTWDPDAT